MAVISAKDLDFSSEMRAYFESVRLLLVRKHDKSPEQARALVDRFFGLDVDPLERALVMHDDAEAVAEDLSKLD